MQDLSEHIELVIVICGFFIAGAVSLIVYIWKSNLARIKVLEAKYDKIQEKVAEIELEMNKGFKDLATNYKSRFEGVHAAMNVNQIETIKAIDNLKLTIEKQTQYCYLIQEQKKKDNVH